MKQTSVGSTEAVDRDTCSAWPVLPLVRLHSIGAPHAPPSGEMAEYADPSRAATAVFDCALDAMNELRRLHLNSAQALAEHALDLAQHIADRSPSIDVLPASIVAQVLYERGRVEQAHALIAPCLPHLRGAGMVEAALRCYRLLACIARSREEHCHALALLADAEEVAIKCRWPRLRAASLAQQVEIRLGMGLLDEATVCAHRLETLIGADAGHVGRSSLEMTRLRAVTQARVALARPNSTLCVRPLRDVYRDCASRHDFISAFEVGLVLVQVQIGRQLQDEACDLLATLMRYAVSAGLMQTLVDCGDSVGELIAKLGWGDIPSRPSDIHSVRAYARLIDARRKLARRVPPCDAGVDTNVNACRGLASTTNLSDRESLIVGLMGQGMTNKQIAMHLRIAPETVKSHAKRLFTKLSAKNRAEAVTVATRLGLVQLSANRSAPAVA